MKNLRARSSGDLLAAMLAFSFKSKLTFGDNLVGKRSMLKGIFVSPEVVSFDRERIQRRQKITLALKATLEDLDKIKESLRGESEPSLNSSEISFETGTGQPGGSPDAKYVFSVGLSKNENRKSFADLATLTQSVKTPFSCKRRQTARRVSEAKSTRVCRLPMAQGQFCAKNLVNTWLKMRDEIMQPRIKEVNGSRLEARQLLSSIDFSTVQIVLLDIPIRLKFCWEGFTETATSAEAFTMVPFSSPIGLNVTGSSFDFDRLEDVTEGQGLDASNDGSRSEFWATANSTIMVSQPATPVSNTKVSIREFSNNSKKTKKRRKLKDAFITNSAKKLFSTSSPISSMGTHRDFSSARINFELKFDARDHLAHSSTLEHQMAMECDVVPSALENRVDCLIPSQNDESGNCSLMDTTFQKSPTVSQSTKETQSEFSSHCSKSTQEASIQTDILDVPNLKEESFYEHGTLIPEVNKVGLIVGSLPDAFNNLQTIVKTLEPHGALESIAVKRKREWVGFFASYELHSNNERALNAFMEKPFGRKYLRAVLQAKLGTYSEFAQASPMVDPTLEFVNVLSKMKDESDNISMEMHLLAKVDEVFRNLPLDVPIERVKKLLDIVSEEKEFMPKHLVWKVKGAIFREAKRRIGLHNPLVDMSFTTDLWQCTLKTLRASFVKRFERNPVNIIDLLPIIGDEEMILELLNTLAEKLSSRVNVNLQPVYANLAKICSEKFPVLLSKLCDILIIHIRRIGPDTWAAELITTFGSSDHFRRVNHVFEFMIENLNREGISRLLECILVFCNQNKDRLYVGFGSSLESLLNHEALSYVQIGSIFTCELAQGSFETFCRLISALMGKFNSSKNACERWILIARKMPQWVGSNDLKISRRNILITSTRNILSMLEEASNTYRSTPVQENWARETSFLDSWREVNQHSGCPGCNELRSFLKDPVQISYNITVNDSGRKCVKKILSSTVNGSSETLALHLNLVFEELDFSQNMKLYNSRRCGAIDVRKNPSSSQQSQFLLQWFDDAKREVQGIIREIEQTTENGGNFPLSP